MLNELLVYRKGNILSDFLYMKTPEVKERLFHEAGPGEWRFVLTNTAFMVCPMGISVHSDISRHLLPALCWFLEQAVVLT